MRRDASPRSGCGVAVVVDGRLLLLQRLREPEAGCWGIPGGKVELFETVEQAARREIREELGIGLGPLRLLAVTDQIDRERVSHWVSPVLLATVIEGEPRNVEPAKHAAIGWFPLDDLPHPLTASTRAAVDALDTCG
jgi:ADP-ribose pyrophosphatase YjhB (NUDIX family)